MRDLKKDLKTFLKISPYLIIYLFIFQYFFGTICIFDGLFGMPCPGCGLSRSFIFLIKGNIKESLNYHAMLIPTILFLGYSFIVLYVNKKFNIKIYYIVSIVFFLLLISYYIYRLINFFPNIPPLNINSKSFLFRILKALNK